MSPRKLDPSLVRQRNLARATRLKRRLTTASILGFAAFFGLAAQHVVRGASASTRQLDRVSTRRSASASTTYFDQSGGDFSFGVPASSFSAPDTGPTPPPMAQTSVS